MHERTLHIVYINKQSAFKELFEIDSSTATQFEIDSSTPLLSNGKNIYSKLNKVFHL